MPGCGRYQDYCNEQAICVRSDRKSLDAQRGNLTRSGLGNCGDSLVLKNQSESSGEA